LVQEVTPLKTWDEKLDYFVSTLPALRNSAQHYKAVCASVLDRIKAISDYDWNHKKTVKSQTTLLRPVAMAIKAQTDYGLSKVCISLIFHLKLGVFSGTELPVFSFKLILVPSLVSVVSVALSHC
jgi:hypothetical protein